MAAELIPVGPGAGPAGAVLKSHEDAIRALQQPLNATAVLMTTIAKLPPPSAGTAIAIVSDIPALAFSDGVNWFRADTGGVIV